MYDFCTFEFLCQINRIRRSELLKALNDDQYIRLVSYYIKKIILFGVSDDVTCCVFAIFQNNSYPNSCY